eukprot:1161293-Pelagomonas_calceolata.AAC.9
MECIIVTTSKQHQEPSQGCKEVAAAHFMWTGFMQLGLYFKNLCTLVHYGMIACMPEAALLEIDAAQACCALP